MDTLTEPNPIDRDVDYVDELPRLERRPISQFQLRLYKERAGLDPEEALMWWEHYVTSSEAAVAIREGRTPHQEYERRMAIERDLLSTLPPVPEDFEECDDPDRGQGRLFDPDELFEQIHGHRARVEELTTFAPYGCRMSEGSAAA